MCLYIPYKAAVDREGLTPQQYGMALHKAVDQYFRANYAQFDPLTGTFNTEFSLRKDTNSAYYAEVPYGTLGSNRFDAYEDVGNGTVCGYDIKTGPTELSVRRIEELRSAAIGYYRAQNNDAYPRQVYILQVRSWR